MEQSESKSLCLGGIYKFLSIVLILLSLSYLIAGIFVLIYDYNIWKGCINDTELWPYVLVSLILCINKANIIFIFNTDNKIYNLILICSLLFESILATWGSVEVFIKSYSCYNLLESKLWDYGLVTLIFQIIFDSIIIIKLFILCLSCKTIDNRIIPDNS